MSYGIAITAFSAITWPIVQPSPAEDVDYQSLLAEILELPQALLLQGAVI
ncbi:MAG: hypothetical protein ACRD9S_10005 [Pyrinomonadaceae bacterium]